LPDPDVFWRTAVPVAARFPAPCSLFVRTCRHAGSPVAPLRPKPMERSRVAQHTPVPRAVKRGWLDWCCSIPAKVTCSCTRRSCGMLRDRTRAKLRGSLPGACATFGSPCAMLVSCRAPVTRHVVCRMPCHAACYAVATSRKALRLRYMPTCVSSSLRHSRHFRRQACCPRQLHAEVRAAHGGPDLFGRAARARERVAEPAAADGTRFCVPRPRGKARARAVSRYSDVSDAVEA
jgi:hypothetical protein